MKISTIAGLIGTTMLVGLSSITLAQAQSIQVGHLADYTGATSDVGTPYGQGVADAFTYINSQNGINGKKVDIETVDYGYQVPRAVSQYKKWSSGAGKVAALLGWGTADTEALVAFVSKDEIPYISGSYSGALTDPTGMSNKAKAAPYNFFYGPSYSDGLRAMLIWAAEDWKAKGKTGAPKYVHMGANHPYPNAPKEAGEVLARELGFEVVPAITFPLTPGDYTSQCLTAKNAGVNYAYLGNTAGSNISVLKACKSVGADIQFLGNVWGMDENAAKAAGDAANGVVFPVRTAAISGDNAPGMAVVRAISKISDPSGSTYRPVHYISGICAAFLLKESIDWASKNGGVTGPNVAKGMYQKKDWVPAGLEGVCLPSNFTDKDHRGVMDVAIYRSKVNGPTEGNLQDLMTKGTIKLEKVKVVSLPRKAEWLGW